MTDRPRFRIMDLVVAVAAAAAALAAYSLLERRPDGSDVWEIAFWLVAWGYLGMVYVVVRFVPRRGPRLVSLGVALAFAAATLGVYCPGFIPDHTMSQLAIVSLAVAASLLTAGGIAHGLLDHWNELKNPPPDRPVETTSHPLDRDPTA